MHHKLMTFILDGASGTTFLWGWFTGQDALMILGAMASIAAIVNHADQWWQRNKNKK